MQRIKKIENTNFLQVFIFYIDIEKHCLMNDKGNICCTLDIAFWLSYVMYSKLLQK